MISRDEAIGIVAGMLRDEVNGKPSRCVVTAVQERPHSWVVRTNSRAYVETRDSMTAMIGGAPYVISKATGEVSRAIMRDGMCGCSLGAVEAAEKDLGL